MKYFYIKKKYTHRILQTNITREYIINLYKNIYITIFITIIHLFLNFLVDMLYYSYHYKATLVVVGMIILNYY